MKNQLGDLLAEQTSRREIQLRRVPPSISNGIFIVYKEWIQKTISTAKFISLLNFRESMVLMRTIQCCLLNGGVFWASILIFNFGLLPFVKYLLTIIFGHSPGMGVTVWSWIQPFLSLTFGTIWVLPLFLLSKIVNSLWFQV